LAAGIDDLGGIDLEDVINPAYPQPAISQLRAVLEASGWQLKPRTCTHQHWWRRLPPALRERVERIDETLQQRWTTAAC
jgi:FO synthase subunit 1